MTADYVLNRASLLPPFDDLAAAKAELAQLIESLATIDAEAGVLPKLRTPESAWLLRLVDNGESQISLAEIIDSFYGTDHHNLAEYFFALDSMSPPDKTLSGEQIERYFDIDLDAPANNHHPCFLRASNASEDLKICAAIDALLISLKRGDIWSTDHLAFQSKGIDIVIDHIASAEHAASLVQRRLVNLQRDLTIRNLWSERQRAFRHLDFGQDVEAQLKRFDGRLTGLLFRRLSDLDQRAAAWGATGTFPLGRPPITPESPQTMSQYTAARTFRCPEGRQKIFEEHIWIDGGNRIHLFKNTEQRRIEIGYIGRHLPTLLHPT